MTDIESVRQYTAAVIARVQITQPIWIVDALVGDADRLGYMTPEEKEHLVQAREHLVRFALLMEKRCGEIGCKAFDLDPSLMED